MSDVDAILKFATRFSAALTGYDRVMAYVFRSNDTGEVRAEALSVGMESFLGLRYPASDIPKQARALYVRSPVRSIDDSSSDGSPILPVPSHEEDLIDLSNSVLRSVSPIHLEYLRNMGVAASLSISLVLEGRLWGLIACHHRVPKHLPQAQRNALVLFAQMLSLIIGGKLTTEDNQYANMAGELINNFSRSAATTGDIASVVLDQQDVVMQLMTAEGLAVVSNGSVETAGQTPSLEEIKLLAKRLNAMPAGEIHCTSELASFLPEAADFVARAAGMLSIPISKTPRDYILFFRPEVVRRVKWAGNPEKPVTPGPNGIRLTPRKSFEAWRSLVEGQSEEWTRAEITAAEQFRVTVLEVVLRMADEAAAERERANEKQELLIAELNHRVRNILGLVRGLISQTSKNDASISEFADVLESRIHSLARAHDQITKQNWSAASLKALITTEAQAYLSDKSDRVIISGPDVEILPVAYSTLALVMHEMITNSAKYGSLSDRRGRVELSFEQRDDDSLDLNWRELDGPAVQAPKRRGFGSTITERSIPFELHGESKVSYDLSGVKAHFWIPGIHISRFIDDQPLPQTDQSDNEPIAIQDCGRDGVPAAFPASFLLVEDNMIIAMDTEGVLLELGAKNVRVCADVATALEEIENNQPQFGILDVNLGRETSLEVARKLNASGIPFIFASGYGDAQPLIDMDETAIVITKPYDKETLRKAIHHAA
ncbi:HWE histidine kinase domain-containing protein [Roseibium sp. ROS1]